MGKNHKRKDKNNKRCIISNKIINGNEKDVVLTEYAIEYVRQLGYEVMPLKKMVYATLITISASLLGLLLQIK